MNKNYCYDEDISPPSQTRNTIHQKSRPKLTSKQITGSAHPKTKPQQESKTTIHHSKSTKHVQEVDRGIKEETQNTRK